jgi:curved DNA-binding protein CbpA
MKSRLCLSRVTLLGLCVWLCALQGGLAQETAEGGEGTTASEPEGQAPKADASTTEDDGFDPNNRDWGTYYDPQAIFCGSFDCYKILGFDYESFGKNHPDTKTITKRYRKLSRAWHPDKSKHRDAKERFVKIARAYEVLTNNKTRKEYDFLRYDQEAYFQKYGTSVLFSYAPKSDVTFIMILILVIANVVSWFGQKSKWQRIADRLVKATVEDWTPAQGGSPESRQLREQALVTVQEQEQQAAEMNGGGAAFAGAKVPKKKGSKKVSSKDKKKVEQMALEPIVKDLVYAMDDFGAGFHKPTWRDLVIVTMFRLPYDFAVGLGWNAMYMVRRLQGKELSDEEREVLSRRAVGPIVWDTIAEEERKEMMQRELWISANMGEWEEEQEVKKLTKAEQKEYFKMKKKGKVE